jgi:iron(III) transport system permease protein
MTSTPSNIPLVRKFFPKQINHINTREDWIMVGVLLLGSLFLLVGVVFPLYSMIIRSLQDSDGQWIGLTNYIKYVNTPSLVTSLLNTFKMAITTAILSVVLGFYYAYALTRTAMPGKFIFRI